MTNAKPSARDQLIGIAIDIIRQKGFGAARIEDICGAAGVSKGAFFHHFANKEAIAIEAASAWGHRANRLFEEALAANTEPRAYVLAYLDMRIALLDGEAWKYMCYAGTLVEEVWQTHPAVHVAAAASVNCHIDWLQPKFASALGPGKEGRALELATLSQAMIQGALIIAKTDGDPVRARQCLRDLKTYIETALPWGKT